MLTLVVRRALVQRRMLAGVVALVTAGTTLLGVCALLLSVTQDRAFTQEVQRSEPQDVDVTAYVVGVAGPDVAETREEARRVVGDVLAPLDPAVTSTVTSRMRRLGTSSDRLGYLVASEAFPQRADLTSGRWPDEAAATAAPAEAVVPDTTASRLRLRLGEQVTLGKEIGTDPVEQPVTVVVVGTFRPRARAGWDSDTLSGAGFKPDYSDGAVTAPAYGPFVVSDASFLATGSTVEGLRVTAHPSLGAADDAALRTAVATLDDASGLLKARVGDRVRITRVASDLPATLDRVHAQQAATRSTVLVVVLLGTALTIVALLLAGRLVGTAREEERALLLSLGLGRRQLLLTAIAEALLLAAVAALLAVPAAALAHSQLTRLPGLESAHLTQDPTITWGLVLTVLAGAALLAFALVVPALAAGVSSGTSTRRRVAARSGIDVLLLAAAATAWWQLRSQPVTAATSGDVTLTVAPALCVAAVTVVAVRCVPILLGLLARAGDRSRSLVLPLAAHQAARRPDTGTAMVLLAGAVASATFGIALGTTWDRSQQDQAALRVGTDLSLGLTAPATSSDASAVVGAVTGKDTVVSAVTTRPLALGHYLGDVGSPPLLVALDSRQAGALLRGRLDTGRTWTGVGTDLAPGPAVGGLSLPPGGAGVQLEGQAPAGVAIVVTTSLLLQDDAGFRTPVSAAPVPVDGRPHALQWREPIGSDLRVVALQLKVSGAPAGGLHRGDVAVSVALHIPTGTPADASDASDASWQVHPLHSADTPTHSASVSVDRVGGDTVVLTSTKVDLSYLVYGDGDLLATAFEAPPEVPVAVSRQLADAVGVKVGGELSATIAETVLPLRVVTIVPTVPSTPGRAAVLADIDTLSRALIGAGSLDPVVDGWWVGHPSPDDARALQALALGDITTRDDVASQLTEGPLQAAVPAALVTLVVTGVVLLLAGAGLLLGVDQRRRTAEGARLRALGLDRGGARRLLLAEHSALLVPLVLVGALVGAAGAVALGPDLVRSDLGIAPVPTAVVEWPWPAEAALVGGLLLACMAVAALVTSIHVRRSDPAHLRSGDW